MPRVPHSLGTVSATLALAVFVACGPGEAPPNAAAPEPPGKADPGADEPVAEQGPAATTAGSPRTTGPEHLVLVTEPAVLESLEAAGLTAGAVAFGQGDASLSSFAGGPRFRSLRRALERDLAQIKSRDPKAGVGMRHPHRLFDASWFDSDKTRFELVGVVNRLDRHPFAPNHCGETRLVYRLAYASTAEGEPIESRLPMTVNVVFWQDVDGMVGDGSPIDVSGCKEVLDRWDPSSSPSPAPKAVAQTLLKGPLAPHRIDGPHLKSVEINVQSVRWPSVVHPSLAGHAEYSLRVFHLDDQDRLVPSKLENVPDVERISKDPSLRQSLLAWLREPAQMRAIDDGTVVLPDRYLAERATSLTPRGLGRLGNRPFAQVLRSIDFEDVEFDDYQHVRSPAGIIRRLDGLSCQGCHETRSVAGFHLLGEPRDPSRVLDTLAIPSSAHLDGELGRRRDYLSAIASNGSPSDARPLSDHERIRGGYGSHCGLGDPSFDDFECKAEFECVPLDDPDMGTCLTSSPRHAGDPCETGTLVSHATGHKDRVKNKSESACQGAAVCNKNAVGFPGGMCTPGCEDLDPGEACGTIVNLAAFNNCVARKRPFTTCIEKAAFPVGMRSCDPDHRCRDDYICARSPHADAGVCIPPYFLFQLRVDGHVL